MARLLGEGGLDDEAREPLLEAALDLGRALATEARLPEPASFDDALLPPRSLCWNEALAPVRAFAADATGPWRPAAESMNQLLGG
jgi:hypothetical protein